MDRKPVNIVNSFLLSSWYLCKCGKPVQVLLAVAGYFKCASALDARTGQGWVKQVFSFISAPQGKKALLITTDNYLQTGVSEIHEFTAGSLTARVPSSGPYFLAAFAAMGSTQYRRGNGCKIPPSFVQMPLSLAGFWSKTEEETFLSEYAAFKWSASCLA